MRIKKDSHPKPGKRSDPTQSGSWRELTWHVVFSVTPQTIRWIPSTHTFSSMLKISCYHLQTAQAITLLAVAITEERRSPGSCDHLLCGVITAGRRSPGLVVITWDDHLDCGDHPRGGDHPAGEITFCGSLNVIIIIAVFSIGWSFFWWQVRWWSV